MNRLLLVVAFGFLACGQPTDPRAAIDAAYQRADAAYVAAKTLADLESIREWLDTPDCVYTDFGQPARRWSEMKASAAEGLRTRIVKIQSSVQQFEVNGDTAALGPPSQLGRTESLFLISWIQDESHGAGERLPLRLFGHELPPSERPDGGDPAFRLQPMDGRVQGTGLDLEQIFRSPLNVFGDGVAMSRSREQRAKDDEVERTLQHFHTRRRFRAHCVGTLLIIL
jgi:hypothetical protein